MGIVQATTPGTFLVGSLSATFVEDKTPHTITDTTTHTLETVNWTQTQTGQIEVKYFIIWRSGNTTQGLSIVIQLDGVEVPMSTLGNAGVMVSSDVNDDVFVPGSFFLNVAAGAHTLVMQVATANAAFTYTVKYSQLGIR